MTFFLCWVVAPLVLVLVATGCGLLVEQAAGFQLPGPLAVPVGVALTIVAAGFATAFGALAQFAVPLVVGLAAAGYFFSYPWRGRHVDAWAVACGVAVFATYAAPIVLSGHPTFAGYQTLDDTSTWLALTDHVMDHGRTVAGLAPSTYEVVLHDYLDGGVPLGAFMVLGVGGKLTGQDIAWLFQPTLALFAALLGLSIYAATSRFISSRPLRALVAVLAAQPALLFAYALWSGIKELSAAAMIALVCGLVAATMSRWTSMRGVIPVALAAAALVAILSVAGVVWLVAPELAVIAFFARRGARPLLGATVRLVAAVSVFAVPSILIAYTFLHGAAGGELTAQSEVANLGHPLSKLQLFGIWPATDFRTAPHDPSVTHVLIGVVVAAAGTSTLIAWRKRAVGIPLYLATGVLGAVVVILMTNIGLSSPWLSAKAMAEGSPALLAGALAGAAVLFETGRRTEASIAIAAVAAGVLWSNGLAYSNVWLAPYSQLRELETIGQRYAGDGPALLTEYQPYGARHFLRSVAPEAASERRRRFVDLRGGGYLNLGQSADLDRFQLGAVLVYRTLVLRRSPVESRPPSVYRLVWKGHWYEVWQRPNAPRNVLEHVSLGDALDPAGVPSCAEVLRLGRVAAGAGGVLATVVRPARPNLLDLSRASFPSRWKPDTELPGTLIPHGGGEVSLEAVVDRPGTYSLWLGGSFRRTATVVVDGHVAGTARDQLNNEGQWTPVGEAKLGAGRHSIALRYGGSRLAPGTGGLPFALGPLMLTTKTAADTPVTFVEPGQARSLCRLRLDWVEALAG
jgi:hypothetical protein